jgi:hemolysin III
MAEPLAADVRPWLRGSLHRGAALVAIALTVIVAIVARSGAARAAVIVYGGCISAMFATSGTYHARRLADRPRLWLRRLDHSMILVAIAGTYTAVIQLALEGPLRIALLATAWLLAVIGGAVRLAWLHAPSGLIVAVYLVAGWQIVLGLPAYVAALTGGELALLAVGGALYTAGAVVYALRRPDPWPRVAGYHEVFHLLVVAAAAVQWVAVLSLATRPH